MKNSHANSQFFKKGNFMRKLTNLFKKRHYFYAFYRSKNHKTKNWYIVRKNSNLTKIIYEVIIITDFVTAFT